MAITDPEPRLLVEAHNAGDEQAFAQIVRVHHRGLFAHAVRRLHDPEAAEDAVQETFVRAYRALPRFQGDYHLRAWLHRILTNVCHDEAARRRRQGRLIELVSAEAADAEPADAGVERLDLTAEVVTSALDALPTTYREAVVLRDVDELTYEQVAAATGVTEGNARVRVMRGRAALRRALASSNAIVIAVVPWLRRGGRGDVTGLSAFATSNASVTAAGASVAGNPGVLSHAPLLLRAADTAPQVIERAASLPQVLGVLAAMAVPIAAPVVGDRVVEWVAPPPAAVSAPAAVEAEGGPEVPTTVPPPPVTATAPPSTAPSAGAVGAAVTTVPPVVDEAEAPATTTTTTTTTTSTTTAVPVAAEPRTTGSPPVTAPPTTTEPVVPVTVPAPAPVEHRWTLQGRQLVADGAGATTIELHGQVVWRDGAAGVAGVLSGALDLGVAPPEQGVPAPEGTTPPTTGEPVAPPVPSRPFSGELLLALDDGKTYELRLSDGAMGGAEDASTAAFELVDTCGTVVATGAVEGQLALDRPAVPAYLDLRLTGTGPATPPSCP